MQKRTPRRDGLVVGLALFAMFFGAGNLIFPPVIGLEGGTEWVVGYITYFLADFGLAIFSIMAMLQVGGKMERVTGSIGKVGSTILNVAIILCIGPMLAIPRTAATSFEMGVAGFLGVGTDNAWALAVFSVLFFAIVLLVTLRPSKVVGRVGKILTPVLVATLAVLIIVGVMNPAAPAAAPSVDSLIQEGVSNGYQTMDMLAALAFSIVVIGTIKDYGYGDAKTEHRVAWIGAVVAGILLFLVYGGLAYLGATTGQLWASDYAAGTMNQAALLTNISNTVLGRAGTAVLVLIVVFACLTTAIGLISSCGTYFAELSGGRVSYRTIAVIMIVFSAIVCNIGLSQIISIAAPILTLVYPAAIYLTVMSVIRKGEQDKLLVTCRLGAAVAFIVSLLDVLVDTFGVESLSFVHQLPLDGFGFGWLVPTLVAAVVGACIDRARERSVRNAA